MKDRISKLKDMVADGSQYQFANTMQALALASIAIDLNTLVQQQNSEAEE